MKKLKGKRMAKHIYVISPVQHSVSVSNSSIANRAKEFAKVIATTNVAKVTIISIKDYIEKGYSNGYVVLIDFRIGDILEYADKLNTLDACLLLIHYQDEQIYDKETYIALQTIFKNNKTNVATASSYGKNILIRNGIHVNSGVIRLPIRTYTDGINSKALINKLNALIKPKLLLWLSPAVRKNSYFGIITALEAIIEYNKDIDLTIVSRYYDTKAVELAEYFGYNDINIKSYVDPSNEQLDILLSESTTVYLPSYDEGFNLPMYESARLGCDVVVSNILVHEEGKKIYDNILLIPSYNDFTIAGNKHDEIRNIIHMKYPSYYDTISVLISSFEKWKINVERMKTIFMKNIHKIQPWRSNINTYNSFINTSKRRNSGRAVIKVI